MGRWSGRCFLLGIFQALPLVLRSLIQPAVAACRHRLVRNTQYQNVLHVPEGAIGKARLRTPCAQGVSSVKVVMHRSSGCMTWTWVIAVRRSPKTHPLISDSSKPGLHVLVACCRSQMEHCALSERFCQVGRNRAAPGCRARFPRPGEPPEFSLIEAPLKVDPLAIDPDKGCHQALRGQFAGRASMTIFWPRAFEVKSRGRPWFNCALTQLEWLAWLPDR